MPPPPRSKASVSLAERKALLSSALPLLSSQVFLSHYWFDLRPSGRQMIGLMLHTFVLTNPAH